MIPNKTRESRRTRTLKLPKNLERLYKERKCRDCAVVVTRMDFAKILGKFTKVKIQYESSTTSKTKQNTKQTSPNTNARLKSNENGMVLVRRDAYNQHPVKTPAPKKAKINEPTARVAANILKENNRLKKPVVKDKNSNYSAKIKNENPNLKQYSIIFEDPLTSYNNNDGMCKISLVELLPHISEIILPSDDWCIDYFPKSDEPKDDKVYDRIAAELEDLMYSDKPATKSDGKVENKVDDFPSIMDILNDNSSDSKPNTQSSTLESNLESSDVEAMLLGKSNPITHTPMEVDNTDVGNLIEDQLSQLTGTEVSSTSVNDNKLLSNSVPDEIDNPQSPSILDEALQTGIEEHLPVCLEKSLQEKGDNKAEDEKPADIITENVTPSDSKPEVVDTNIKVTETDNNNEVNETKTIQNDNRVKFNLMSKEGITHLIFKKLKDGSCYKSVTCPKNLKYGIEFAGKSVEFIGAPKYISSLEDLQVLLQIVHESQLDSLYVLH